MLVEAFVLAKCQGKHVLGPFAYYAGEGEWTIEDNARVFSTRFTMKQGLREARAYAEPGIEVHAFGVYVEE